MIAVIAVGFAKYFAKQYKDHYSKKDGLPKFLLKFLLEGSKAQQKITGRVVTLKF